MNKEWLNLSGAAEMLGVHPSTIRKWSDEGKLPVHLTQGGHRRYLLDEVKAWKVSRVSGDAIDIDQVLDQVLQAVRIYIQNQSMENEQWYMQMDTETKEHYRASGRSLAHAILFHLVSTDEDGEIKAQAVGFEYASRSRKHNLSVMGATRAFLFFRKLVLDAILSSYQSMHGTSPAAWAAMLRRFNQFSDQILMSILANFETYNGPKN